MVAPSSRTIRNREKIDGSIGLVNLMDTARVHDQRSS